MTKREKEIKALIDLFKGKDINIYGIFKITHISDKGVMTVITDSGIKQRIEND
jgi:hypothetical protein